MRRTIPIFILIVLTFRFNHAQEIDLAVIDSAYIAALKSGDSNSLYAFIKIYQDRLVSALASCRLIHREMQNDHSLDTIVEDLKTGGIDVFAKKEFINATNIYFPSFKLRTTILDDYNHHLLSNPLVDLLNESATKYINISFDALHIMACMNHFKLITDGILYYAADSVSVRLIRSIKLHSIFKDFSARMGYKSPTEVVRKLLKKESYMNENLVFFVYDYDAIREKYRLYELIGSDVYSGVFYIDPNKQDRNYIIRNFVYKLSHLFFNAKHFTTLPTEKNWLEYGFANWAAFCYTELNTLVPEPNSFLDKKSNDYIKSVRAEAKRIFQDKNVNRITLKEINNQLEKNNDSTWESNLLALSLVAFIVEKFGPDKLVEIIKLISHTRPDRTELATRSIINWTRQDVERHWNKWVNEM